MRAQFVISILFLLVAGSALAQDITTDKGKLSYSVGWDLGADIKRRGEDFDVEALITAIRDSVAERDPQVERHRGGAPRGPGSRRARTARSR